MNTKHLFKFKKAIGLRTRIKCFTYFTAATRVGTVKLFFVCLAEIYYQLRVGICLNH